MTKYQLWHYGAVADAADQASVAEVRQVTHDRVLSDAGERRRSGVSWREVPAHDRESTRRVLTLDGACAVTPELLGYMAFLDRNPRGLLIVASCTLEMP
jgi:hypothetical protein